MSPSAAAFCARPLRASPQCTPRTMARAKTSKGSLPSSAELLAPSPPFAHPLNPCGSVCFAAWL
eukprot:2697834-Rhodomonas_salina.1